MMCRIGRQCEFSRSDISKHRDGNVLENGGLMRLCELKIQDSRHHIGYLLWCVYRFIFRVEEEGIVGCQCKGSEGGW